MGPKNPKDFHSKFSLFTGCTDLRTNGQVFHGLWICSGTMHSFPDSFGTSLIEWYFLMPTIVLWILSEIQVNAWFILNYSEMSKFNY